ncbi:metal-dependent hydrolase [Clostridium sp. OS1-26]|uniref:metal-dependent hydrolase n=1 Tax=Clostridium sp. OS1-26 TaxID=3070681 RepID=UPI0027DF48C6|nr:metal-dependent hydrolase [Clostridium sp. OS1-26]WML34970.1 metal-dependent hydrolase [Clostridium sp. OS1-26]
MMKRTHIFAGATATLPFINATNILFFPIVLAESFVAGWDYKIGLKHRGITHTALALLITSSLFSIYSLQLGLLWGLNYGTHLLLDSLTVTGVPLLYPIKSKYYSFKLFKTRSSEDMFICLICIYLISYLFLY